MKELQLMDNLFMKQDGYNVTLFEKTIANKLGDDRKPTGETYVKTKDIAYFGTVYQALQYIVKSQYDISEDLLDQFKNIITLIDNAEEDIKNRFRIEVKKV